LRRSGKAGGGENGYRGLEDLHLGEVPSIERDDDEQSICSLHIYVRGLPDSRLVTTQTEIAWRLSDFQ
jgi:hypothetical protein